MQWRDLNVFVLPRSSRQHQGIGHEAMANHERHRCPLLLGERQELRGALTQNIAVEGDLVRDREAVEDREQQQWVFGRLAERFSIFDQQTCPLCSRLGFRRRVPFDMDQRGYERHVKLICSRRNADVVGKVAIWSSARVSCLLPLQCRAVQRPLSRLAPPFDGRFSESRLGEVMR